MRALTKHISPLATLAVLLALGSAARFVYGVTTPGAAAPANKTTKQGGTIHGSTEVGTTLRGGVKVIAISRLTGKVLAARSNAAGMYSIAVTQSGRYTVHAEFGGVVSSTQHITVGLKSPEASVDFSLANDAPQPTAQSSGSGSLTSLWPALILAPVSVNTASLQPALSATGGNSGAQLPSFTGDVGFSGDALAVNGQSQIVIPYFQMADQMRQDFENGHELQDPVPQAITRNQAFNTVVTGGTGSDPNHLIGVLFWAGGFSALNASPFLLAGQPVTNPSYNSNNYGLTIGGAPFFPGHRKPNPKDFLRLSISGQQATTLVNDFGVVPTELERDGNFSRLVGPTNALVPIYRPGKIVPYPNNTIDSPLDPAALALLHFVPLPNLQSTGLNYRLLATQDTHTNTLGASFAHNFEAESSSSPTPSGAQSPSRSVNLTFNVAAIASDIVNLFPEFGGKQRIDGYSLVASYTLGKGNWLSNFSIVGSRNNAQVRNHFSGREDVATESGVLNDPSGTPINDNPLNYGLPNLVLNNFSGLTETQPNSQVTETAGLSADASWSYGAHIVRWGGDLRRAEFNLFGGTNATGTYVFTGGYTQIKGGSTTNPVADTGSSFADYLLGLPQQTKIEAATEKAHTRQTYWDGFVRDDWHVLPHLTVLAGLRYDYFSPYVEIHNRLSTLDYSADFSEVQPVQPNGIGPVTGLKYPRTLIAPDRNDFAPHLGFAWQAQRATVVRAGYGINYTVGQYGTFVQNLAYQEPFAKVEVNGNIPHFFTGSTLQYGFGDNDDLGNYAVNRNYQLPYVQHWYLDIEQSLPLDAVLDVGYVGAKGTHLDVISAPGPINMTPFANAFFDYEDCTAFSNFNSLVVRMRRRLQNGIAVQAVYAYSHSIDDASSVNAGIPVVAQNAQDILAEESNSSFDIRHQATGSILYQLPFGPNERYLNQNNFASHILGDWTISGYFTVASGLPLTPYVAASVAEVERGTHGSVRPNRVAGVPLREGGGHIDHWFNKAAFSTEFAPGQLYGTASRYSIPGPGVENFNLSVSKLVPIKESSSVELRATANNAFNIVQYSGVNTQISSSTFGYVNAVQPMRQITFLARLRF